MDSIGAWLLETIDSQQWHNGCLEDVAGGPTVFCRGNPSSGKSNIMLESASLPESNNGIRGHTLRAYNRKKAFRWSPIPPSCPTRTVSTPQKEHLVKSK